VSVGHELGHNHESRKHKDNNTGEQTLVKPLDQSGFIKVYTDKHQLLTPIPKGFLHIPVNLVPKLGRLRPLLQQQQQQLGTKISSSKNVRGSPCRFWSCSPEQPSIVQPNSVSSVSPDNARVMSSGDPDESFGAEGKKHYVTSSPQRKHRFESEVPNDFSGQVT